MQSALNSALERLPENLRARFIAVLEDVRNIRFRWATKSTKEVKVLGHFKSSLTAKTRWSEELMLHGSRNDVAGFNPWADEHNAAFKEIIAMRDAGKITTKEAQVAWENWKIAHPAPDKFLMAGVEDVAGTLIHELTHGIDHMAGKNIVRPLGISPRWIADGMQLEVQKAYYGGAADIVGKKVIPHAGAVKDPIFSYAVTKPSEGMAEAVRMYYQGNLAGDAGRTLTAEQWRAEYPTLARWVEENIIGAS